jgi:DNA-binding transcriptional LysR family regulator
MMAMELDQVEAFVAIVRRGGFTRAGTALHLSQPAISRRIQMLEHELGAPLFERVRSGVLLTEAGRALLPHAEAVLASVQDARAAVDALREKDRGTVTLALVGTLASSTLTDRLRLFRERHPAIDLRLRTALSREVSALVRRGEATLGLRYDPDPDADLLSLRVHDERMVVVARPGHGLARAARVSAKALAAERWVTFPSRPGGPPEPYSSALAQAPARWRLDAAERVPIDSLTAQKRMVEAGFGLALLPESSVQDELRAGSLRALRVAGLRASLRVELIRRRRGYLSGAAQALLALLSERWPAARVRRG